jgi:hypothetical protein
MLRLALSIELNRLQVKARLRPENNNLRGGLDRAKGQFALRPTTENLCCYKNLRQ